MSSPSQRGTVAIGAIDIDAMRASADDAAQMLKMLANGQRLRVLCLLVGGELSVGQINARVELSQSALSQHLAKLRDEGLVTTRREAQTIYYTLASGPAQRIIAALHDVYCGDQLKRAHARRRKAARR
ncbi:MAG: metalloregulator ArsR/SmtB family transcription factor [Rudaea sp.]